MIPARGGGGQSSGSPLRTCKVLVDFLPICAKLAARASPDFEGDTACYEKMLKGEPTELELPLLHPRVHRQTQDLPLHLCFIVITITSVYCITYIYEGTSFSGKKCSKDDHLSALMLSCLLTDFDYSSVTVKLTHKCSISFGVHSVVFQARKVQP